MSSELCPCCVQSLWMFLQLQHDQTEVILIFYYFFNSLGVDVYHMQGQMQSTELFKTKLTFSLLLFSLLMNIYLELTTIISVNSDTIQRRSNKYLSLTTDSCAYFLGVRCHGHSGNRTWALCWTHLILPIWAGFHAITTVLSHLWLHWTCTLSHLSDCDPTCIPSRIIIQSN